MLSGSDHSFAVLAGMTVDVACINTARNTAAAPQSKNEENKDEGPAKACQSSLYECEASKFTVMTGDHHGNYRPDYGVTWISTVNSNLHHHRWLNINTRLHNHGLLHVDIRWLWWLLLIHDLRLLHLRYWLLKGLSLVDSGILCGWLRNERLLLVDVWFFVVHFSD